MLSVEGIGKNIEQAINNALLELKAPREDVDIKIINEGGLFKKAKVLVSISEDCVEKYEKRQAKREAPVVDVIVDVEPQEEGETDEEYEKYVKGSEGIAEYIKKDLIEKAQDSDEVCGAITQDPKEFLKGLFKAAGKEITIEVKEDDKYITYAVQGEDLGDMIGHRGECYFAINRLLGAVAGRTEKKILLDIGGYREKRAESLTNLAKRTASRVAKTKRYVKLEPMNPSDRRIIHTALQADDRVTTLSKGDEPNRYVIVFPKDQE